MCLLENYQDKYFSTKEFQIKRYLHDNNRIVIFLNKWKRNTIVRYLGSFTSKFSKNAGNIIANVTQLWKY